MPDVQHNSLGGAELHEPKGVSAASSNQTYVADGLGSGAWAEPEPKGAGSANAGQVYVADGAGSGAWTYRRYTVTGVIADVSTAETVYVPIPYSGNVVDLTTVLEGAITVADATILIRNSSATAMGGVTVAFSGSAAGDVDFDDTLVSTAVTDHDYVTVETDGGSTTAQRLFFTVTIERDD